GYLGLLDLGVRGAVTRYVAKFHAESNHRDASRTASSAMAIFATAGFLALLVSLGMAFLVVGRFKVPEAYQPAAKLVLCFTGLTVAAYLIGGVYGGILVSLHRFDLKNVIEVCATILRSAATVAVLLEGKGIISLALLQLIFSVLTTLVTAWTCQLLYRELQIRYSNIDSIHLRLILTFSLYSFLLNIFSYIILYTDAVVVAAFLPISSVTFFSIAGNLIVYARGLISGITSTMTPLVSRLEAEHKVDELRRRALDGS